MKTYLHLSLFSFLNEIIKYKESEKNMLGQILISLMTIIGSGIVSIFVSKYEFRRLKKDESLEGLYNKFWILRDTIHQGRAYDFVDLFYENQEKIVSLLIETYRYQTDEIRELVYELKVCRLANFDGYNKNNINICNKAYTEITKIISNKYLDWN